MVAVVVITIVVVIVIMIIVMIAMVVVRTCRLVMRCVIRLVVMRTVMVVVVVIITVVISYVSRMTLYPIRRCVIYVYGCVPKIVCGPRIVPHHRIMGTHVERTPQYGCRSHRHNCRSRRSDIHIVIICGNGNSRTVKPLDSHLVGVVHIILHVVNVAVVLVVGLRVGGYRGNHRHYYE